MSDRSKIEWTDATWNIVTGCTKVSAGCANCYAERVADRQIGTFAWNPSTGPYRKFTDVQCHPERLSQPLHWRKPRRVFVCSMGDLFHEAVPGDFIAQVFGIMQKCPQHTFQVLTKRAISMRDWFAHIEAGCPIRPWPTPNVWLGVSCENQAAADERIPLLLQTPAAVRFVSLEPLLGPVNLTGNANGEVWPWCEAIEEGHGINWAIVGGESGPKARLCRVEWIESIIDQCRAASVPCFVKQLGANPWWVGARCSPIEPARGKCNKPDEWPESLRVREYPR